MAAFTLLTLLPSLAFHLAASQTSCASLLQNGFQRKLGLEEPGPRLVQERPPVVPVVQPYSWASNCDPREGLRNASRVQVAVHRAEVLRQKAESQLRLAEDAQEKNQTWVGQVLLELRQGELMRFSQDKLELNLFNPSVVPMPEAWKRGDDEVWLAAFRHMELARSVSFWCMLAGGSSVVVLAVLDAEMRMTRPVEVVTVGDLLQEKFQCQDDPRGFAFGPEDPRLFIDQGKVLMFFNARAPQQSLDQSCPATKGRMYLSELTEDLVPRWTSVLRTPSEQAGLPAEIRGRPLGGYEKNWSPFLHAEGANQRLFAVQDVNPHVVLDLDAQAAVAGAVVYNTSTAAMRTWRQRMRKEGYRSPHGGVSAVLISHSIAGLNLTAPFYLSILHTQHGPMHQTGELPFVYESYLYAFEGQPPFSILKVSERPLPLDAIISVFTTLVAFPVQLQLLAGHLPAMGAAPTDLMVFYGAGDTASFALRMPLGNLSLYL